MALHTPRRSPRIAKRANKDALTPTRSKLRRFLKAPEDDYFTTLEVCINQRFPCVKAEITTCVVLYSPFCLFMIQVYIIVLPE